MTCVPNDPDTLLQRDRLASALTEAGYPTSPKTLATIASRGGGPPFHKYGARVLYRWGPSLAWAKSRLSAERLSSSDADAVDAASRP
jgi:hypothetical protein